MGAWTTGAERQVFEQNFLQRWSIFHTIIALHLEKVTTWCALWSEVVIGPCLFKNDDGTTVTANLKRCGHIITDFFLLVIEEDDLENMWLQKAVATWHTTRANTALLQETFPCLIISRRGDINWPPRSCDLKPLNFLLWEYAKDRIYADKPSTLEYLKTINIRQVKA